MSGDVCLSRTEIFEALTGIEIPATVDGCFYDIVRLNGNSAEAIYWALFAKFDPRPKAKESA